MPAPEATSKARIPQRQSRRADPALVQACLDGRAAAWDEIVRRYSRLVYSIPRKYGFSDADAEDVYQNVFAILVRRLPQLRDQTRISAWLITTTHRECWRAKAFIGRHGPLDESTLPERMSPDEDDAADWERQHLVRMALDELGGKCQSLLTALFLASKRPDYEAIGRTLGIPVGSIGPTRARCFEKLRPILRSLGVEDEE